MTSTPELRIRTPDQRLRVFVSSSLVELVDERSAVRRAIETLRLTPVMFELGARPYPPRALYRAYLEQSHVFLGIYWQSYGWVAPDEDVSGLEDEYRLSGDHPRLVYVRRPAEDRQERLNLLLRRIETDDQTTYRQFSDADELEQLVQDDLMVLLTERFQAGDSANESVNSRATTPPPVPITPIIGRSTETAEIQRLLADGTRILTLLGPGGVGKSRLALEACRSPNQDFTDGVAFVPLEHVDDASDVMRLLVRAVGGSVEGAQTPLEVAIRELSQRRVLLLLDNFEQVLEAGAELTTLLQMCPRVAVVVTSRRPLRVRGERQLVVEPLAVPGREQANVTRPSVEAVAGSPAATLFVERAREVRSDFTLDDSNAVAVATIVRRLDGLPLAIELTAARANVLEPDQILERLERGVGVSMPAAGHDVPERQRTLRATLEWSCALLTSSQRTLLARLSVFADGATLEAIEAVCVGAPVVDIADNLSTLLDNGLLRVDRVETRGQPRFVLLQTVQEFAVELLTDLGETQEVTTRFLDWAVETATQGDPVLHRDAPGRWPELLVEARNLRLAARLTLDAGDWQSFTRLAWGMFHWIYRFDDMNVFLTLAERALAQCGVPYDAAERAAQARLVAGVCWGRFLVGDAAGALAVQGIIDLEAVAESDPACAALLYNSRCLALPLSDGATRASAERSLALADSSGFAAVSAYTHAFLANLDLINGDFASAEQHCHECVSIASDIGTPAMAGQQYAMLALVEIAQGRLDDGRTHLVTACQAARVEASLVDAAVLLGHVAVLVAKEGRAADASRLRAAADATMGQLGLAHWPMFEGARRAALGDSPLEVATGATSDVIDRDPWEELATALQLHPFPRA